MTTLTANEQLMEALGQFYDDPLGYVMFVFPWDTEESIQMVPLAEKYRKRFNCKWGPDEWACEFLDQLGEKIRERNFDGKRAVLPIQFSTASGHGIGKTVLTSFLIKFILDTRPRSKGMVTATTATQLRTKTWAELGKWHKMSLTNHLFRFSAGRDSMVLAHKEMPGEWNCQGITCKEENSESFQGLHASNSTPFYIFDEASGVPDPIFEAREGGTTDGEPMTFDFGNATRNTGYFFENCVGRFKHRYIVRSIDSRSVYITNKAKHQIWIDDYGIDSDFVKVRVLGRFPSAGSLQFIESDDVKLAMQRSVESLKYSPLVLGVDVARRGQNSSCIYARRGNDARTFPVKEFKGYDAVQLSDAVIAEVLYYRGLGIEYAMIFVDSTGVGGPVRDILFHAGYKVTEVNFGNKSPDPTYRYVSDMIWGRVKEAIKSRLALPHLTDPVGPKIYSQLTQRDFGYTLSGKISLESKEDMEARVGSPDEVDALACTYFREIAPLTQPFGKKKPQHDYDPMAYTQEELNELR